MAGHSKWANIKHRKAKTDAKKGKVFSRLIKEIMVAARVGGGDINGNPRLRTAIEKAKSENVPNDNIERAIRKGAGELKDDNYEEFIYEGYGPGGVAVLVLVATDNRNRAASGIRHAFNKCGGRLGESGSVAWIFENTGLITFDINSVAEDELIDIALKEGALDVAANEDDKIYEVYTEPADFHRIKDAFIGRGIEFAFAELTMVPKMTVRVEGGAARQTLRLMDELEDLDDVQGVYANFDMPADAMEGAA